MTTPEEKALKVSRRANFISIISAAAAIFSAGFAGFQYYEARQMRDMSEQSQVRIVFFDVSPDGSKWYLKNRNNEPMRDVFYTYRIGATDTPVSVQIGNFPACSSIQLAPENGDYLRAGFTPTGFSLLDTNGKRWHKDEQNRTEPADSSRFFRQKFRTTVGIAPEEIRGTC